MLSLVTLKRLGQYYFTKQSLAEPEPNLQYCYKKTFPRGYLGKYKKIYYNTCLFDIKRRANWNAYMRKYNARKKAEREQKDKQISLQFNKSYKSYDKEDVNKCLSDCISILTSILNRNIERIPQYRIDQINKEANNRDMLEYINALMDTIEKLL